MRWAPVNLPPLELDWSDFEGELVLGHPNDLPLFMLKRMQTHSWYLRGIEPDLVHFKVDGYDVRHLPLGAWEKSVRDQSIPGDDGATSDPSSTADTRQRDD